MYKGFLEKVAELPSGRWNWGSALRGNSGDRVPVVTWRNGMEKQGPGHYLLGQVTSLWASVSSFLKLSSAPRGCAHSFGSCKLLNFL